MTHSPNGAYVALDRPEWPSLLDEALCKSDPVVLSLRGSGAQNPPRPDLVRRLLAHPKPVLGLLEGRAEGSAASLLLACDKILWRRGGSLHLGLSGSGEMALSVLRLGHAGASRVWFSGGKIAFRDAAASGWAARLTGDSGAAVEEALAERADLSEAALSLLRPLLYHQASLPLSQAEALERAAFGLVFESGDPAEGARAFLEKRRPVFGESGE